MTLCTPLAPRLTALAATVLLLLGLPSAAVLIDSSPASASAAPASHFVWTADLANTSGDAAYIVNDATDDQPNDLLFVTPNFTVRGLCGCVFEKYPIGVSFDTTNNEWSVVREDGGPMPVGETFNVLAVRKASASAFLATADSSNTSGDSMLIDSTATNGKPKAILQVTENSTGASVSDAHPLGVFYDSSAKQWGIVNEDQADMPVGASFNVLVGGKPSSGGATAVLTANSSDTNGDSVVINSKKTTGNPDNVTFVTQNLTAGHVGDVYNGVETGVWYNGSQELVFDEDGSSPPLGASFNLLVFKD